MKISFLSVAVCLIGSALSVPLSPRATSSIVPGSSYDRIVIIVLENTDYSKAKADPYLASLAQKHNGQYNFSHEFI
jgi:hypothetical protein